jgi:hydrogenase maturation protein HypF
MDRDADGCSIFDPIPLLIALGRTRQRGVAVDDLAAAFHESVVDATAEMVRRAAESTGCRTVALGGGCFQNARLLARLRHRLDGMKFEVLVPQRLSPNDGAISFGQAAVAAALLQRECELALQGGATGRSASTTQRSFNGVASATRPVASSHSSL